MSKKITLTKIENEENVSCEPTPKALFMTWCVNHLNEIAEMVNDYDVDILDAFWPEVLQILKLENDRSCTTCKYENMPYDEIGNSCWNCKAGTSEYERR